MALSLVIVVTSIACGDDDAFSSCLDVGCPAGTFCQADGFCAEIPVPEPTLSGLDTSTSSELEPRFAPNQFEYELTVGNLNRVLGITPRVAFGALAIRFNGTGLNNNTTVAPVLLPGSNNVFTIEVENAEGAFNVYTLRVTRRESVAQISTLAPSELDPGAGFGTAVAISGDRAAVAAPGQDGSGVVHVLVRVEGVWQSEAVLEPPFPSADEGFGHAIAIHGERIAVASVGDDSTNVGALGSPANDDLPDSGAAFVFARVDREWVIEAYIKPLDASAGDRFGDSIALERDRLVVGDSDAEGHGAAYVFAFHRDVGWYQEQKLVASNADFGDEFGASVAITPGRIAVGAPGESGDGVGGPLVNTESESGAAYVFQRGAESWQEEAYLKADNADAGDRFGVVALHAGELVVGAPGEASAGIDPFDNSAPAAGAAYLFEKAGTWLQWATFKSPTPGADDGFGSAIAIHAGQLAIGAPGDDGILDAAPEAGAVVLYSDVGGWQQQPLLHADPASSGDAFGRAVAVGTSSLLVAIEGDATAGALLTFE